MLSDNIRLLRKQLKLTQQQVADGIGIPRNRYGHYETGRSEPSQETVEKIARFFHVPVAYLYSTYDKSTVSARLSDAQYQSLSEMAGVVGVSLNDFSWQLLNVIAKDIKTTDADKLSYVFIKVLEDERMKAIFLDAVNEYNENNPL